MLYYISMSFMEYMYTHKCAVRGSCTHICKKRLREYSLRRLCLYEYEVYSCIKNMSRDFVYNFLSLFIHNEFWIGPFLSVYLHLFYYFPIYHIISVPINSTSHTIFITAVSAYVIGSECIKNSVPLLGAYNVSITEPS